MSHRPNLQELANAAWALAIVLQRRPGSCCHVKPLLFGINQVARPIRSYKIKFLFSIIFNPQRTSCTWRRSFNFLSYTKKHKKQTRKTWFTQKTTPKNNKNSIWTSSVLRRGVSPRRSEFLRRLSVEAMAKVDLLGGKERMVWGADGWGGCGNHWKPLPFRKYHVTLQTSKNRVLVQK